MKKSIQKQLTAHDKILIFDNLRYLLEGLEEYIEKAGYYPNFRNKRQLQNITIPKAQARNLSRDDAEDFFKTNLVLFVSIANEAPDFLKTGELRDEFYKWINSVGIDVKNCRDEKLKCFLIEINNVLEGDSEKIVNQTQEYLDDRAKTNQTDFQDLIKVFGAIQKPLNKNREQAEFLKGKTYKDAEITNKFGGNVDGGREVLNRITETTPNSSSFHFYSQNNPQQRTNTEIIQDVIQNPQNWRLDEIFTGYENGREKEEILLIHSSTQIDYDVMGNLKFAGNLIYQAERFSQAEIKEIKQALNISENDENRQIIEEVKQNRSFWKIRSINNQIWIVHDTAQINNSEIGHLIHPKQRFADEEWAEIENALNNLQSWGSRAISNVTSYGNKQGYKLEVEANKSVANQPQKDNKDGKIELIATISVFSAVVIGGVILVAKNKLNKKVKK